MTNIGSTLSLLWGANIVWYGYGFQTMISLQVNALERTLRSETSKSWFSICKMKAMIYPSWGSFMDKFENVYTGPTSWAAKTTDPWLDVILCCFLLKFFIFEQGDLNTLLYTGPHRLCSGSYVHKILCIMPIRIAKYLFQGFLRRSMRAHFRLFVTPWTIDPQAPLSMEFSRQEY